MVDEPSHAWLIRFDPMISLLGRSPGQTNAQNRCSMHVSDAAPPQERRGKETSLVEHLPYLKYKGGTYREAPIGRHL